MEEKIIGREAQQELYLLELLLGHVTYISPEKWRNTFPFSSPNFEETTSKLCCERTKKKKKGLNSL